MYLERINSSTPRGIITAKLLSTLKSDFENSDGKSTDLDGEQYVSQVIESDAKPQLMIKPFNLQKLDYWYIWIINLHS